MESAVEVCAMKKRWLVPICVVLVAVLSSCSGGTTGRETQPSVEVSQTMNEMDEARQVVNEFCLDNGYTAESVDCREGGDGFYVFDLIASRHDTPRQITLSIEKTGDSWEVVNEYTPAIGIDDMTYYDTGKEVPVEPDESVIEYLEVPVGANDVISAFARLDEGKTIVCLINEEWHEFAAEEFK